jgi:protein-S-isoprenylcysteine O-methyltransferase Ste14
MTITQQDGNSDAVQQEVANPGPIRPPIVYLISLLSGVVIHLVVPWRFLPAGFAVPLGVSLVVVAIALFSSAVGKFRAAGTLVPARQPTTTIVRTGPYRFSRNPIYLAFSVLQLGIAMWVNSVWLLITLAGAVALINFVVIPREERYLERKFGALYLDYKVSVRRWL